MVKRFEALDDRYRDVLRSIIPEESFNNRMVTLYCISEFELHKVKDHYVSEIRDHNLRQDILSIPLLLRIQSGMYFPDQKAPLSDLTKNHIGMISKHLRFSMQETVLVQGLGSGKKKSRSIRVYKL